MYQIKRPNYTHVYGLGIVLVFAVAVAVLGGSCFADTKYTLCERTGLVCPVGWACTFAQDGCTRDGCGDGIPNENQGEQCDDGNKEEGDGCDSNCKLSGCGNGMKAPNELCDDGNTDDGDGCDSNCTPTGCHNGITTGTEMCDDGNLNNEDACIGECVRATCGDRMIQPGVEDCDDGNTDTEPCTYHRDERRCTVCDATCHNAAGATSFCGDGVMQVLNETCDDGNNLPCGSCSADCQRIQSAHATGQLTVVTASKIKVGETFTLRDGINTLESIFTFTSGGVLTPSGTKINFSDNVNSVRAAVSLAINDVGPSLLIVATFDPVSDSIINLRHELPGEIGNQDSDESVGDSGFGITDMDDGAGGNCNPDVGCTSGADCKSNVCIVSTGTMLGVCM